MKEKYPEFVKYGRIPHVMESLNLLDNKVEIYEKLDGGNTQVRKYKGRILCGSRSKFLGNPKYFSSEWFKSFQDWALSNYSFYNLPENLIVYGEWLSKHTLDYYPEFTDNFFLIDIFDLNKRKFIPYRNAVDLLKDLGIEKVNFLETLAYGKFDFEDLRRFLSGSKYRNGDKEGIVIKNYSLQKFAKLLTSSVKEKTITKQDILRVVLGFRDEGKEISVSSIFEELLSEAYKNKFNIKEEDIKKEIERCLHESKLLNAKI